MKRYFYIIFFTLLPCLVMAQATGGEIRRPTPQRTTRSVTQSRSQNRTSSQTSPTDIQQRQTKINPEEVDFESYNSDLVQLAQSGYSEAQYALGLCYVEGKGVEQSPVNAFNWFNKAAHNEYFAEAHFVLGLCYYSGYGIDENKEKAVEWFRNASQQEYADAQYALGTCYLDGEGVAQSDIWAAIWFEKAANNGLVEAQLAIAECYYSGKGVTASKEKCVEWIRKAAEQNSSEAQYALGLFYENGEAVTKDLILAAWWYSKSAEQGYALGQYALGNCYKEGIGVIANPQTAIEWYKKAEAQGVEEAKSKINEINNTNSISKPVQTSQKTDEPLSPIIQNLINNMVYVEGSSYTMGATTEQLDFAFQDEKPSHRVTVSSFSIGKYEVTQKEWEAVMGNNPSYFKGLNKPVENVSWDDCNEFISKLNSLTGRNFRLPTEEEWEYAARGGKIGRSKGYVYSGDDNPYQVAWIKGSSEDKTHDVGLKTPNELGLFDMSGNVYEWCQNFFSNNYGRNRIVSTERVARGGSWNLTARYCRVSHREHHYPLYSDSSTGFRLAL